MYVGLLSETKHTAYNIWVNKSLRMTSMNYKKNSAFIPAGTKVKDISADLVNNRIQFVTKEDKKRYTISFKPKHHKGKTVSDYAEMMFTKDFGELIEEMTEEEKHAIKKGILEKGMSKRAIIVSYGYPPESHTQSLDDNVWTYYLGLFKRKQICFDENDRLKGKCEKE
jgi:hypothetical protein